MSEDLYTCQSCGLKDNNVECRGIFHCPNPRCRGSGGAWFRSKLQSFKIVDNQQHEVDEVEWGYAADLYISTHPELKAKLDSMVKAKTMVTCDFCQDGECCGQIESLKAENKKLISLLKSSYGYVKAHKHEGSTKRLLLMIEEAIANTP